MLHCSVKPKPRKNCRTNPKYVGAQWPSGLERCTGDFGNSVYPALPVPFGGDTKSRRSLLSGVYARGSKKIPHRG